MKNIHEYEANLQKECTAIIKVVGELHCLACGKEFEDEYTSRPSPYHHPICGTCRNLHFVEIAKNM